MSNLITAEMIEEVDLLRSQNATSKRGAEDTILILSQASSRVPITKMLAGRLFWGIF